MWGFISGGANAATLGLGYLLLSIRHRLACVHNPLARGTLYYTTLLALVVDPLNLSIRPLLYGGDLGGITVGLNVPPLLLQLGFGILLLVNRELVAQVLLPAYGVVTNHPLVQPWFTTTFFRGTLCFIAGYFFLMGAFLILFPNLLLARLGEPGSPNMLGILRGAGAATVPYTMLYILLVVKPSEYYWAGYILGLANCLAIIVDLVSLFFAEYSPIQSMIDLPVEMLSLCVIIFLIKKMQPQVRSS